MRLAGLSVILLTALVELANTAAIAQRGLSNGQSADRPSAPSNTRVAQYSAPPDGFAIATIVLSLWWCRQGIS